MPKIVFGFLTIRKPVSSRWILQLTSISNYAIFVINSLWAIAAVDVANCRGLLAIDQNRNQIGAGLKLLMALRQYGTWYLALRLLAIGASGLAFWLVLKATALDRAKSKSMWHSASCVRYLIVGLWHWHTFPRLNCFGQRVTSAIGPCMPSAMCLHCARNAQIPK